MKKLILLAIILSGCNTDFTGRVIKYTYTIEIEDCRTGELDTIQVNGNSEQWNILTHQQAVPVLSQDWNHYSNVVNVCRFKVLDKKPL